MDKVTLLMVYINDMVVTRNDPSEIVTLQRRLETEFELKDLGNLKNFLGIEFVRLAQGISLS